MKEIAFLNRNAEKWERFDALLNNNAQVNPDELAKLFIELTDDLSYARTFYPDSNVARYLNNLALRAHMIIYRNRKEKSNRIVNFWKYEFPLIIKQSYRQLLYAFLIFFIAMLVGVVSSANDDSFVRLILGDAYVNMTLDNIDKGDPMAVYKSANNVDMFLGISLNNIWVSFLAFVFGLAFSIGTGYVLVFNGIMLGAFQYFFYRQGLLYESLTIWIHGTLEIFSIIVAGAAGMTLGNSILFPGTYKRIDSFTRGVKRGLKIVLGLIPMFIIAATFEGFVTRYTQMPNALRLIIIFASLAFIVWYFFIYPQIIEKKIMNYGKDRF
ncbi:MAG: stage II sporulation protein M [Bacteroidota bacterium]